MHLFESVQSIEENRRANTARKFDTQNKSNRLNTKNIN